MMGPVEIVQQRLQNQRLAGERFEQPRDVVEGLLAMQAQDYLAAKWAVAARTNGVTDAAVDEAFARGEILRTHVMRPTWHLVAADDIRWLLDFTGFRVQAGNRSRYRELELDDPTLHRSYHLLAETLEGGNYLTRRELAEVLEESGIDTTGQRLPYILMFAELEKLICSGPLRGKQHTYALLRERVPSYRPLERHEALLGLTTRYFTSRGPATVHDLARWSGITVAEARLGTRIAGEAIASETIDGQEFWFAPSAREARHEDPSVHLLPVFDEYFSGYRDHRMTLAPASLDDPAAIQDVYSAYMVVVDGRIAGTWKRTVKTNDVSIDVRLLTSLTADQRDALQAEAERYGQFLNLSVSLSVE